MHDVRADVDLSVVGDHEQRRAGRERFEHVGDEPVGGAQLGLVVLAEAALVGDLVDAAVVGVHEAFAGRELVADLDRHRRGGPPADRHRPAQVGTAERRRLQLGRADHRHGLAEEGREGLDVGGRDAGAGRRSSPMHQRKTLRISPPSTMR